MSHTARLLRALIIASFVLSPWRASGQETGGDSSAPHAPEASENGVGDSASASEALVEFEGVVAPPSLESAPAENCCASSQFVGKQLEGARALSRELRIVERQVQEVEVQRSRIRLFGPDFGRSFAYSFMGVMWLGAIVAASTAGDIEDGLRSGDINIDRHDTDGDGDVDRDDVRHTRRVARVLLGTSILPLGLGIFSWLAKLVIKLIHSVAEVVNHDPDTVDSLPSTPARELALGGNA